MLAFVVDARTGHISIMQPYFGSALAPALSGTCGSGPCFREEDCLLHYLQGSLLLFCLCHSTLRTIAYSISLSRSLNKLIIDLLSASFHAPSGNQQSLGASLNSNNRQEQQIGSISYTAAYPTDTLTVI